MYHTGLILEGGGMKGVYTAGVTDFFLDKGIEFNTCYGVSAGAINMVNFISKQRERTYRTNTNYINDKRYCSIYSLITTGDIFGVDYCYNRIPNELDPYDYETYQKYKGKAYAVVTNLETGMAEYMQISDMKKDMQIIRASSSLPLVSRNVKIGGKYYLDGGISDSIPLRKSIEDGNHKNVIILTKEIGYRRKPSTQLNLLKMKYRRYPKIVNAIERRHIRYNKTLAYIEMEVAAGRAFVIRPKEELCVQRLEKDVDKLKKAYKIGYQDAADCYDQLIAFLEKER